MLIQQNTWIRIFKKREMYVKATLNKSAAQDEEAGRGPAGDPARLSALGPVVV